ncbi:sodium-dependent glucose transporter 1A-like [Haliotis rufescens]|uniref:sodium-dependent glucose transporter 1A-like n=1 Tax=Haliotis rufescens TaxID=6454 RepID=UPI00201F4D9D|nr:sodium-dependent glucose transporter 1A-like [Haliotis rufescens]
MGPESVRSTPETVHFRQQLQDPEFRRKFIHTLILYFAFLVLGVCRGQHGPAFLDLAQITGSNVEEASIFYTSLAAGGLVGSVFMGVLIEKVAKHRQAILASSVLLNVVSTSAIPWSKNYFLTISIFFVNGMLTTAFDAGGNFDMMSTSSVGGKMFIQILHFVFAVGTIIAPLTVEPFLAEKKTYNATFCDIHNVRQSYNYSDGHSADNSNETTVLIPESCLPSESSIQYAYMIAGALCLLSGIMITAECFFSPPNTKRKTRIENHRNPRVIPRWLRVLILGTVGGMYFFSSSSISVIVGYIMAYFVNDLGWSKEKTANLTSVYWAGYAASRLLCVLLDRILNPLQLLFISNGLSVLSLAGLWLSIIYKSDPGIWICMVLAAIGMSAIFPTAIVYIENDVMKVSGMVTSVIWVAVNLQGILNPLLLGYLFQTVSFKWYIYITFIEAVLAFVCFVSLVLIIKTLVTKYGSLELENIVDEKNIEETFIEKIERTEINGLTGLHG